MKCLCGYEYKKEFCDESKNFKTVIGDEKFVRINAHFTYDDSDYFKQLIETTLYACPKCGTIKKSD